MKLTLVLIGRFTLFFSAFLCSGSLFAQYPPPAGHPGTTAMYKDSSAFIGWAATCSILRGYISVADTTLTYNGSNKTTFGSYLYASGPPDELVVSLGDHGYASLGFDVPIVNRAGPDFAVFENSFGDSFLELGFVEVSSDGQHFVRFPSVSLTQENQQVNTFDTIDAVKIHNLAGKYRHAYGTPFDLDDLKDSTGIDLSHITTVRILDAGGCLQSPFALFDSQGHKVNDPWPTPFDTGGFDLDAVGVIHNQANGLSESPGASLIRLFPNPVVSTVKIFSDLHEPARMVITDAAGRILLEQTLVFNTTLDLSAFPAGIYIARFSVQDGTPVSKKIVKQ